MILAAFLLGMLSTLLGVAVGVVAVHFARTGVLPQMPQRATKRARREPAFPAEPEPLPPPPGNPPPAAVSIEGFGYAHARAAAFDDFARKLAQNGSIIESPDTWTGVE